MTVNPWEFLQRNGWYLVAVAVVVYAAVKRADEWAANRHAARAIAEATDPTRLQQRRAKLPNAPRPSRGCRGRNERSFLDGRRPEAAEQRSFLDARLEES